MTQSFTRQEKPTEADIAYDVLKTQGSPLHYLQLIEEVLRRLGIEQDAARIAAVLTQINLDTRFSFMGKGDWGLKVWDGTQAAKRTAPASVANKAAADEEDDLELDVLLDEDVLDEEVLESEEAAYDETDESRNGEKW